MPLGNLTSQFFANVYLNELDYFVKHELKVRFYLRYVDDFILLHSSKSQLEEWKKIINQFLIERLGLELHSDKSKIYPLSKGVDFVGFRNFFNHRLLKARNIRKIRNKISDFEDGMYSYPQIAEIFQGWQAYARWGSTYNLRRRTAKEIYKIRKSKSISSVYSA